ncbi:DMT family transporter [Shimazuella kribbensis]|uniref:DMT family transporter n=1 Tax=Shimazuella kribbensis TaxID=139808 RepID=UPI000408D681|nr:DMT family transporter [Shimazuella kribbensis]
MVSRTTGMVLTALLVTFLWGSVAPAIKLGYQSLGIETNQIGKQVLFAGHITLLASFVLFLFLRTNRQSLRLAFSEMKLVGKVAFFQIFLNYLFFFLGVSISTGVIGSIMAGTTSFFQLLFAHFLFKNEKLTWTKNVGLILGLIGLMMLNITHSFHLTFGWGEGLLLASVLAGAWGNLLAKDVSRKVDTKRMTAYAMCFSGIALSLIGIIWTGHYPFSFTVKGMHILFYLGIMSATALLLWNELMHRFPVSQVSLFLFLIPIFGVMISSFVLEEQLQGNAIVSLLLVAFGIMVIHFSFSTMRKDS